MSRDEESSRRSRKDMRMTAVKTVSMTVVQEGSRTIEDDAWMTHFYRGDFLVLPGRSGFWLVDHKAKTLLYTAKGRKAGS